MSRRHSRRSLLQVLAVGAGALPVLSNIARPGYSVAQTAPEGGPRRLICLDNQYGVVEAGGYVDWVSGNHGDTDAKFNYFLEPMEAYRQDLVILDGLEYKRPVEAANTHACGHHQMLTGPYVASVGETAPPGDHVSANESIDQYLAEKIGRIATPQFPSLVLGVGPQNFFSLSHAKDGTNVPSNRDPYDVYKKLFSNLMTGEPTAPDPAVLGRLARRKSVLDSVTQDLVAFRARLGRADRERADAQLDAIRAMEQRLSAGMTGATAQCTKPTQVQGLDPKDPKSSLEMYKMHLDVIVAAMACDLTRFATLCFQGVSDAAPCDFAPFNAPNNSYHSISHNEDNSGHVNFRNGKRALFGVVAEGLLKKLKSIPEGNGTMLDNTIIVIASDIGAGHNNVGIPFMTAGGKNLGVNVGKFLKYGGRGRWNTGHPHQRLLVSLLNAMGLPDETFGEMPEIGTGSGPLADYRLV